MLIGRLPVEERTRKPSPSVCLLVMHIQRRKNIRRFDADHAAGGILFICGIKALKYLGKTALCSYRKNGMCAETDTVFLMCPVNQHGGAYRKAAPQRAVLKRNTEISHCFNLIDYGGNIVILPVFIFGDIRRDDIGNHDFLICVAFKNFRHALNNGFFRRVSRTHSV